MPQDGPRRLFLLLPVPIPRQQPPSPHRRLQGKFKDSYEAHLLFFFPHSLTHGPTQDIAYTEIRAILEYMYRGEVNVAQEQLPSLLKVAEALRVKGLFEDDSLNNTANSSSCNDPPVSSLAASAAAAAAAPSSTSIRHQATAGRGKSPSPTHQQPDSYHQQHQRSTSSHHSYGRSPLPSPQGSEPSGRDRENSNSGLNMWPPLVMPLHLGAFESALREREQALALYGAIQREESSGGAASGNGHDLPSGGSSGSSANGGGASKRKRMSAPPPEVDSAPLLRTVLGPHPVSGKGGHHNDIPGLFPFRMSSSSGGGATGSDGSAPADERSHLSSYLPMAMAYAEVKTNPPKVFFQDSSSSF